MCDELVVFHVYVYDYVCNRDERKFVYGAHSYNGAHTCVISGANLSERANLTHFYMRNHQLASYEKVNKR